MQPEEKTGNIKTITVEIHIPEDISDQGQTKILFWLIDRHRISFMDKVLIDGEWIRIISES